MKFTEVYRSKLILRAYVDQKMVRVLNLGCGDNKKDNEFGIDIYKESKADFIFDLNKKIPKKFYNKFDVVKSEMVLDHMGNPLIFLESCYLCLKKGGIKFNYRQWRLLALSFQVWLLSCNLIKC